MYFRYNIFDGFMYAGAGPLTPSIYCCDSLRNLNQKANTTLIRKDVCNCLKLLLQDLELNPIDQNNCHNFVTLIFQFLLILESIVT
ncbi:hypothetical protein RYX36_016696, partial [Vicia faba]